ncbi:hypothetical protein LCGC14_1085600 [marine sediment metagenome]|uniref:Uncharacterized protein n=1 Tax=marine sediment metagenome TaxID=412755 RepID=A0A0F9MIE4_9ZZZZ
MYTFKDACERKWTIVKTDDDVIDIMPAGKKLHEQRGLPLNQAGARDLIVRLQFFVEHGKLPKECPPTKFIRDIDVAIEEAVNEPDDTEDWGDEPSFISRSRACDDVYSPFAISKVFVVQASKEEQFGLSQDWIIGIYDDESMADCELFNYKHMLEQKGHNIDRFSFQILKETLNKIAEIPEK